MSALSSLYAYLPSRLTEVMKSLEPEITEKLTEIRLRSEKPLILVISNTSYFINSKGKLCSSLQKECVNVYKDEFESIFMEMTSFSVYSVMEQLKHGFITLECGARVGIASTAIYRDGKIASVKDISSINIRIPRDIRGCADSVLKSVYVNSLPSIIVAGKPNSGKTTLLRDIARQLSSGFDSKYRKVTVIDERLEFCGSHSELYLGVNSDVLSGFSKKDGIELALRSLSPEIIICDEISTVNEAESLMYAFNCGVSVALSVHASDLNELKNKHVIKSLLKTQCFSYIVLINEFMFIPEIISINEVLYESGSSSYDYCFNNGNRLNICSKS